MFVCCLWVQVNLSTRPDKFVGSPAIWDQAEAALKAALQQKVMSMLIVMRRMRSASYQTGPS